MLHVADCAYPQRWADLPDNVRVVLGYVGDVRGTPHVWTPAEIRSVHDAGLVWGPIWTPPQPPFDAEAGRRAAAGMRGALGSMTYPRAAPVFLDIERGTWERNPQVVMAGVAAWKAAMRAGGWTNPIAYLPAPTQQDWVADWVAAPPENLAPNVLGVQWAGEAGGGRWDLSVFRTEVFRALLTPEEGDTMPLTDADKQWLTTHVAEPVHALREALTRIYHDRDAANSRPFALRHLSEKLDHVTAEVARPRPATVDANAIAAVVAQHVGADLAVQVADQLAARMKD